MVMLMMSLIRIDTALARESPASGGPAGQRGSFLMSLSKIGFIHPLIQIF